VARLNVRPVTTFKARNRPVYFPQAASWYDSWSARAWPGGRRSTSPRRTIRCRFTRVYAGADGEFTLYEDDGLTYRYEKGPSARIPIRWSEASRTLTIGKREGTEHSEFEDA
jgi:alpha-D-xyloside xylohydrolase